MPRKKDYNAVMKPKKHSNKLNVSLIFSSGSSKKHAEDDLSIVSSKRSSHHSDKGSSGGEYPTLPPHCTPSSPSGCDSPTSLQSYPRGATPRSSISSVSYPSSAPLSPRHYSDEHIYDSLEPKKKKSLESKGSSRSKDSSELRSRQSSECSRQESVLSRQSSEFSSVFTSESGSSRPPLETLQPPLIDRESCTTPTNELSFEWHQPPTPMKIKSKEAVPSVMKPQRNLNSETNSDSNFLKRASLKRRKPPKKPPSSKEIMTPNRENVPPSSSTLKRAGSMKKKDENTPPSSTLQRAGSIRKTDENTLPRTTRTGSGSSKSSDSKSKSLPRRLMGLAKTPDKKKDQTDSPPIPPARSSSRKASDSRNGSVSRTLSRNNSLNRNRPNSMVGSSEMNKTSSRPTSMIETGNQKSSRPNSMIETGSQKSSRPNSMIETGNQKCSRSNSMKETGNHKSSRPISIMEIDDLDETRSCSVNEISDKKRKTRNDVIKDVSDHSITNSVTDSSIQPQSLRTNSLNESDNHITQSNSATETNNHVKSNAQSPVIESIACSRSDLPPQGNISSAHVTSATQGFVSPAHVTTAITHITATSVTDPTANPLNNALSNSVNVNGSEKDIGDPQRKEEELNDSFIEGDHENGGHVMIRCDSTIIYNDFEEMEALLLEQEELAENLEKERREKAELEKIKLEQEQKQEEMKGTIKTLEEEIVNVDSQVAQLKLAKEEYDDLEDHRQSLQHKLIEERGKQRHQDDLISVSGMSVYSENGLMLNQDIGDYSKRELLEQLRILRREKGESEVTIKQLRCDTANEKRKQDKVIKDLMSQIRGFHMPVQRQESTGPQETMALITDLRAQLEQLKSQNNSQTKLIERLVTERNQHLVEIARLKGSADEATQLREEVS